MTKCINFSSHIEIQKRKYTTFYQHVATKNKNFFFFLLGKMNYDSGKRSWIWERPYQ